MAGPGRAMVICPLAISAGIRLGFAGLPVLPRVVTGLVASLRSSGSTLLSAAARPDGADSIGTRIILRSKSSPGSRIPLVLMTVVRSGSPRRLEMFTGTDVPGACRSRRSGCPPPADPRGTGSRRAPQSRIAGSGRLHRASLGSMGSSSPLESARSCRDRFASIPAVPITTRPRCALFVFRGVPHRRRRRRAGQRDGGAVGEDRQLAAQRTCSEPSIGTHVPRSGTLVSTSAIGDLDPLAVADARLDLGPHRVAVLVRPAEGLVAAVGEGGLRAAPGRRGAR